MTRFGAADAPRRPSAAPLETRHLVWLAAILVVAFAVRLWYLLAVSDAPGFHWGDPDGYMDRALLLARPRWRWTFDAVIYPIEGRRHALPPPYPVFLSLFAPFPHFPFSARVAQVVLATASVGTVFQLGRLIHTPGAGLVAAGAFALWVPNIFNVWSTSQEALYIPILLFAFLPLVRALVEGSPEGLRYGRLELRFGVAGAAFGVAALVRSMPLFFVPLAAPAIVALARDRDLARLKPCATGRAARRHAAAFVLGFAVLTVPYCIALSLCLGQIAIIDTHGSIHLTAEGGTGHARAPGVVDTAVTLSRKIAVDPSGFVAETGERARSLLYVNGGRILQTYVVARSRFAAGRWKLLVHIGTDLPLIASLLLAPIGVVVCRQTGAAIVFVLWAVLNVAIASVGGFGGARLRTPFEPLLFVLAGAVVAGAWRPRSGRWLFVGVALALGLSAVVLPQLPRSLAARPDYGVAWSSVADRESGRIEGRAGFNVPAYDGVVTLSVASRPHIPGANEPTRVAVRLGGTIVETLTLTPDEERALRYTWPAKGLAFAELEATRRPSGAPASLQVALSRR